MKVVRLAWPLVLASACRIGGPSADPKAYIEFPSDAADEGSVEAASDDVYQPADGVDATSSGDALPDTSTAADAPAGDGGDAACTPPASVPPVCDPITNTGCVLSQCDIDTTHTTPTGVCVVASPFPNGPGSSCTQVSGSVSCQAQYTCYAGTCQKVCFCNGDCSSGQCCSGTAGMTGFGLCGACH